MLLSLLEEISKNRIHDIIPNERRGEGEDLYLFPPHLL